jgi:hypothetical protein
MDSWCNGTGERFWDQTTGMLAELKLLVGRGRGATHVADICSRLVSNLDQFQHMMPSYTPDVLDKWIFYLSCGLPFGHALREPEAGGDPDSKARLAPSPVDHGELVCPQLPSPVVLTRKQMETAACDRSCLTRK